MKIDYMEKLLLGLGILMTIGSCSKMDTVNPTATSPGISSLTAYLTSGVDAGKEIAKYAVTDTNMTDYVIPIPWYYPEESDSTTATYMTAMKVVAEIENNCKIDPPITVLDLTKKNEFTFTNPQGEQRKITISGKRTKSNACAITAFTVAQGKLSGIIDEDNKTITLVTGQDLSAMAADVTLSPHATISPDPSKVHDFNNGFQFIVTADNGTDKSVYTVKRQVPQE